MGLAFTLGKGKAKNKGEASGIKNTIDYWAVNLYGVGTFQYANVIGSVGFIQSENDMRISAIKAKPKTKAITASLRIEKDLNLTDSIAATPYIGARYTYLKFDDFSAGVFRYSSPRANLFHIPVGISLNGKHLTSDGLTVKPFIDVSVSPVLGDRKVSNRFSLLNSDAADSLESRIINSALFNGRLGLEITGGNHSFGFHYGVGAGNRGRLDQSLHINYRYVF